MVRSLRGPSEGMLEFVDGVAGLGRVLQMDVREPFLGDQCPVDHSPRVKGTEVTISGSNYN